MKYDYRLGFSKIDDEIIKYLNMLGEGGKKVVIDIPNTRGISSDIVSGLNPNIGIFLTDIVNSGYQKEKTNFLIYSKDEMVIILREIEKLEEKLGKNWSDIQKAIYFYDRLRGLIKYDPEYETKESFYIRSLRGLIYKKCVCVGISLIYKELLNRSGIDSEFVLGNNSSHTWNLLKIDGNIFPVDLTCDVTNYRRGNFRELNYFANAARFVKNHVPDKTKDYSKLKSIRPKFIAKIRDKNNREREYRTGLYLDDEQSLFVAQVGDVQVDDETYYRYVVADCYLDENNIGRTQAPIVIYFKNNILNNREQRDFLYEKIKNHMRKKEEDTKHSVEEIKAKILAFEKEATNVRKVLFSKEVISTIFNNQDRYFGKILDSGVKKDDVDIRRFSNEYRIIKRSDNSRMFIERHHRKSEIVGDIEVYRYHCFEIINVNGQNIVKENIIRSEMDLINDRRQEVSDIFLSRARLDRKTKEAGGYLGFYDREGTTRAYRFLIEHYRSDERIELTDNDIIDLSSEESKFTIKSVKRIDREDVNTGTKRGR